METQAHQDLLDLKEEKEIQDPQVYLDAKAFVVQPDFQGHQEKQDVLEIVDNLVQMANLEIKDHKEFKGYQDQWDHQGHQDQL